MAIADEPADPLSFHHALVLEHSSWRKVAHVVLKRLTICVKINCRRVTMVHTEISFLGKFNGESASNLLQLKVRVHLWVNFDATLGTTKWYVHTCTFIRHQWRKRLHFIGVHIRWITNTCTPSCRSRQSRDQFNRNATSTDHFSASVKQSIHCVCLCPSTRYLFNNLWTRYFAWWFNLILYRSS